MNGLPHKYSAGGIVIQDGKVLVIHWLSRDTLSFPKGTIEDGESKEETAVREVKEETGYDTKIIGEVGDVTYDFEWMDGQRYTKTVTFYLMNLANDYEPQPSREPGEDFENYWLSFDDAMKQLSHKDSRNLLQKAIALL